MRLKKLKYIIILIIIMTIIIYLFIIKNVFANCSVIIFVLPISNTVNTKITNLVIIENFCI